MAFLPTYYHLQSVFFNRFFLSIVSVSAILALAGRGIYYFWITDDRSRVRTRIALLCTKDVKMYKHKGK
jgi:hypothetical protein